jgi:eukaryotic-like serine/threonine-protein kinase
MLHGNQIGRFQLVRHLDRGAFGDVWLADDPDRKEAVALKLIRLESADPVQKEKVAAERQGSRLQQELASQVPAVAAIYEVGEAAGFLYIAMEYVDGPTLSEVLRPGPLPVDRAVHIALQLARILEISHELPTEDGRRGVIHSDIKPDNVRLQPGNRVRLLDWGVAKSLALSRNQTHHSFGSSAYLSPERLDRGGGVDRHADLWAVGVVLYQMTAGSLPFPGRTDEEIERKVRNRQPPESLPSSCPRALKTILVRCLAFDVERRYPTAAALRADLEAFRDGHPLALAPPPAGATTRSSASLGGATVDRPPRGTTLPSGNGGDGEQPSKPPPAKPALRRPRWRPRPIRVAVMVVLVAFVLSQISVLVVGREVRRELALAPNPDLLALSVRYQGIAWLDPFDVSNTRRDLKAALLDQAERTFDAYRADAATTREDWDDALRWLQAAASLDDGDDGVLARLRYSQGHLDRLDADRRGDDALSLLQRALERFKEAARLAPELPGPHLAQLQVYADERFSPFRLEKVQGAYERAVALHHTPGDRERKALAQSHFRIGMERYFRGRHEPNASEKARLFGEARERFNQVLKECARLEARQEVEACQEAGARLRMIAEHLRELGFH